MSDELNKKDDRKEMNGEPDLETTESVSDEQSSDDPSRNVNDEADVTFESEDGEGNLETAQQKLKKLRDKLKKIEAERIEYLSGWQRAKADLVNARKRDEEDKKEFLKYANEELLADLLPVLDSFSMAFANKEAWEKVDKNWRMGVEYIYSQLVSALEKNNLKLIDPKGQKFDPNHHIALENVPVQDKAQDNIILEVVQKGYELNGKAIRAPKVKVGEYKEA